LPEALASATRSLRVKRFAIGSALLFSACHPSSSHVSGESGTSPSASVTSAPPSMDASVAALPSDLPNRLEPVASAHMEIDLNGGFSWSKDGGEIAIRKADRITVLDTKSLTVVRTLKMKSIAISERCFSAMVERPRGVDLVDLASDPPAAIRKIRWSPKIESETTQEPDFALADDCLHFSRGTNDSALLFDGDKIVRTFDGDGVAAGGSWSGSVTASGHFIAWDTWHAGYVSTRFQDARKDGGVGGNVPTFGVRSWMSPDDRFVVDSGKFSFNEGDGFDKPSRVVQSANGRGVKPFEKGVGPAAFCASSRLFAVAGAGKKIELYDLPKAEPVLTTSIEFDAFNFSFSTDGTRLLAANAHEMAIFQLQSCDSAGSCVTSNVCAKP
jgi:hypothetical protein